MYAAVRAVPPQQVKKQEEGEVGVGHKGGVPRSSAPYLCLCQRNYIEIQPLKESVKYAEGSPVSASHTGSRGKD